MGVQRIFENNQASKRGRTRKKVKYVDFGNPRRNKKRKGIKLVR